jgi:hypothetical protein
LPPTLPPIDISLMMVSSLTMRPSANVV